MVDNMVKVSVIMPVYNDEEFINNSINSILKQTLKDIEIICIDDGSTDNSLKILTDLKNKYNFIKVLSQKNKGAGKARNAGLNIATGEYIAFLDSDDIFIDKNALEEMYNYGIEENSVIVSANIKKLTNNEKITNHHVYKSKRCYYCDEKKIIPSKNYGIPWYFYKNIFKRSFLVENNINFPNLKRGQDPVFLSNVLVKTEEIATIPLYLYGYRTGSGGGANNKVNTYEKKLHYICHFKKTFDILEEANYTDILSLYKKELFKYLNLYNNKKDKDYYYIVKKVFGDINYFKGEFEEIYILFLINQLLNQIESENDFKNIKNKIENLNINNKESIQRKILNYNVLLNSETFEEYKYNSYINNLKEEYNEILNENKKLRKKNEELNKKLIKIEKVNNNILSSNSWKITKPLRVIGRFR